MLILQKAKMDSLTDILNQFFLTYEELIISVDGILVVDNIKKQVDSTLPREEIDFINRVSKPFRSDSFSFLYCYSGEIMCRINMIEYNLMRDDMLFINENAIVEIIVNNMNVNLIGFIVGKDYNPVNVGIKDYMTLHEATMQNPLLHLDGKLSSRVMNTCREIKEVLVSTHDNYTSELVKTYFKVLYIYCLSAINRQKQLEKVANSPRNMLVLNQFLELVEQYFTTERQIGFYADKLCLAPKYASQVIKNASGKKANDWIQERVILEAKLLLLDGNHNVQQVADELNFTSQSFFGKYFKKATGISPKAYVQQLMQPKVKTDGQGGATMSCFT